MSIEWKAGDLPPWGFDLDRALPVHPQFVLSGNIRDLHPVTLPDGRRPKPTLDLLWDVLSNRGCEFLLVYDPADSLRVHARRQLTTGSSVDGIDLDSSEPIVVTRPRVPQLMRALTASQAVRGALVIDYASRLAKHPAHLDPDEHEFFLRCEKISHLARPLWPRGGGASPYNPIIWLVNRPNDLPGWFTLGNESVRHLVAGLPDRGTRRSIIASTEGHYPDSSGLSESRRQELVDQFTLLTEGMSVRNLLAITEIARDPRFGLERIADAIRAFKVGVPDDPWKQPLVRDQIRGGRAELEARVMGQERAVEKTLDILMRSVMGLTGAQAGRSGGRPRGILFFAGPTGVGKTELAKAMTQLLFGDESAYHRFDMSEFSAEHSEARLIGAPPGYVGHDAGGELVNAIRQRPFSVLLFDEIEKAHPRILDKFLQILEDGRLTDGRGETVYFSEAVIVFTSNLGIFVQEPGQPPRPNVKEGDDYEVVSERVTEAIRNHFRFVIQRPELLNRIGDNVVVFDFIQPAVAKKILMKMLRNVVTRVAEEHDLTLALTDHACERLEALCLERLDNGGRGIGNRLETFFINPLARALFQRETLAGTSVTVSGLIENGGSWELVLS